MGTAECVWVSTMSGILAQLLNRARTLVVSAGAAGAEKR
jgi:hypothetical protein